MELKLYPQHFRADLPLPEARELFAASVNLVEIEVFTYCNRTCWFCPNASIPQRQDRQGNLLMDEGIYLRVLDELAGIGYRGAITDSRYNEPLADRETILARIRQARERLPGAFLFTHSNGDFATREYLDALADAGLNALRMQTYPGNDERWDDTAILARQARQLERLGLSASPVMQLPGTRYMVRADYPRMELTIDARNFDEIGTDRGGLVQLRRKVERTSPCFVVFQHLYIDYNGSIVPCCNLRSDVPEHQPYVAAQLDGRLSIFEAYARLAGWRRSLLTFGPKKAPCDTCAYEAIPHDAALAGRLEEYARGLPEGG